MLSSLIAGIGDNSLREIRDVHKNADDAAYAIRFKDVCKTYRLHHSGCRRLLDGLTGFKEERYAKGIKKAVDHLDFDIRRGESVAFLGRNGAGKSTTMKLIAGVAFADSGSVEVNGRISALLGLTNGMKSQLTGRENLAFRGLAMGFDQDQIDAMMDSIIEFAELGDYIDEPLRTYSSGMKSRLGFAFAVAVDPEILIVDEALSVGDARFREKCIARIKEIMLDSGVTLCLVTHSESTARAACNRGIVLTDGKVTFDGGIEKALEHYENC